MMLLSTPVYAAINTIPAGGTVFIGEEGLDISGASAPGSITIGWWASGAAVASTSPDYQATISDTTNFYISPAEFGSRTGSWYWLPAKTPLFNVAEPSLKLQAEDTTRGVDVTDRWVPTDDEVRFRIESNLLPIAQRPGMASVPITLNIRDPSGGLYTALTNNAGASTPIVDIPVTSTPYFTNPIWGTGQRSMYPPGTYTIWAECSVNSMSDNYDLVGGTVSREITVQNQDHNPRITGNYPSTTQVAIQTTSIPATSQLPVTHTLTTISPVTISPVITTPVTVSPTITSLPTLPATIPEPTKSPGFELLGVVVSFGSCILFFHRKT